MSPTCNLRVRSLSVTSLAVAEACGVACVAEPANLRGATFAGVAPEVPDGFVGVLGFLLAADGSVAVVFPVGLAVLPVGADASAHVSFSVAEVAPGARQHSQSPQV